MIRRLYSILCAVLLLGALLTPAHAASDVAVSIGTASASAGSEVSVPIVIQNNPGVAMADLKIEYDSTALTLVSAENGSVFMASDLTESYSSGSPYPVLFVSTAGDRTGDGTLITLRFRVSTNCAEGSYPLRIRSGSMLSNFNETVLTTQFTGGTVTVGGTQIVSVSKTSNGANAVIFCSDSTAKIFCAAYDASGRMTNIGVKNAVKGQYTYAFSLGAASRVKIFVLDSSMHPLCEGATG